MESCSEIKANSFSCFSCSQVACSPIVVGMQRGKTCLLFKLKKNKNRKGKVGVREDRVEEIKTQCQYTIQWQYEVQSLFLYCGIGQELGYTAMCSSWKIILSAGTLRNFLFGNVQRRMGVGCANKNEPKFVLLLKYLIHCKCLLSAQW